MLFRYRSALHNDGISTCRRGLCSLACQFWRTFNIVALELPTELWILTSVWTNGAASLYCGAKLNNVEVLPLCIALVEVLCSRRNLQFHLALADVCEGITAQCRYCLAVKTDDTEGVIARENLITNGCNGVREDNLRQLTASRESIVMNLRDALCHSIVALIVWQNCDNLSPICCCQSLTIKEIALVSTCWDV